MKKSSYVEKPAVIVIVGPTASGKSDLAVRLARRFNGEVISADSRQVYRGMDIGTGKVTRDRTNTNRMKANVKRIAGERTKELGYYSGGIPHHLLDVASPLRHGSGQASNFTVAHYQRLARRAIRDILRRGKLPIFCGGTGLYIDAALYDYALPAVPPNWKLRRKLEKKTAETLFAELKHLDPRRAASVDRHNKRRLVRALEIIRATGAAVPSSEETLRRTSQYEILKIGLNPPQKILKKKIMARLAQRLRHGMIAEVKTLHTQGVSWQHLDDFGLEYRYISRYLRGILTKEQMVDELSHAIYHYAKRQRQWWKKDTTIRWTNNPAQAYTLTRRFMNKKAASP